MNLDINWILLNNTYQIWLINRNKYTTLIKIGGNQHLSEGVPADLLYFSFSPCL